MYMNVISLKNGLKLPFTTDTPYSVDKINHLWNIVVDVDNGQTLSFIGSEVVTICSMDIDKAKENDRHITIEK